MDDSDILARIREMVDAEHELRRQMQEDPGQMAMLHSGFVTSRSLLINAGICFASAAPIVSSHKIQTSHKPDLGNRSRDICSKASETTIGEGAG